MLLRVWIAVSALAFLGCASAAHAQDDLRPLCPDRPGKGTSACTVDQGHFQLEVDAFDATYDRNGALKTTTTIIASPQLKYGVTDRLDLEISLSPYVQVQERDRVTHTKQTDSGIGDLYVRGKGMLSDDGASVTAAIEPFVKLPTANKALGNGAVEGGLLLPLSFAIDDTWSVGATPELDLLKDANGNGHHATAVYVAGLGRGFDGGLSAGIELWGASDFDPAGTTSQYSFDVSGAWQPDDLADWQFDGGVNFGLNRNTPDLQIYTGVSKRF